MHIRMVFLLVTFITTISNGQQSGSRFSIDFAAIKKYKVRSDTIIKGHCGDNKPCIMQTRAYDEKGNLVMDRFNDDSVIYTYNANGDLVSSITYGLGYDTTWRLKRYIKSDTLKEVISYKPGDSTNISSVIKYRYDNAKRTTEFLNTYHTGIIIQHEKYLYPRKGVTIREKYYSGDQIGEIYKTELRKNVALITCLKDVRRPQAEGSMSIQRRTKDGSVLRSYKNAHGRTISSVFLYKVNKEGQLLEETYGSYVSHYIYNNGLVTEMLEGDEVYTFRYSFY